MAARFKKLDSEGKSRREARILASRLLGEMRLQETDYRKYSRIVTQYDVRGIPLGDVVNSIAHLKALFTFFQDNKIDFLSTKLGEDLVPITPFPLSNEEFIQKKQRLQNFSFLRWGEYPFTDELYKKGKESLEEIYGDKLVRSTNPNSIFRSSTRRLEDFLELRINSISKKSSGSDNDQLSGGTGSPPGIPNLTNYLVLTINTQNQNYKIESSPAYFINWSYFGAPTTPIKGPILPGKYIFRGIPPSTPGQPVLDSSIVSIPPQYNITIIKF